MKWVWRILGGIAALLLLCVAGLWLAGMRPNRGYNYGSVEINRPAAQVWRYLMDDELVKKWTGLDEIRHMTPGVTGAGEKLIVKERYQGQTVEMEMTVVRVEPPHIMEFTLAGLGAPSDRFDERAAYVLEETGGRTRVSLSGKTEYYGTLARLMEPLITPAADKKLAEDLARLKALVEAEPAESPARH